MRTVTYGAAASLDSFIARPNHAVDWLVWSDDVNRIMAEFWKTIDTVIMGRKTYEVAVQSGGGAYPGLKTYVCSRTLQAPAQPGVEIVAEDAASFLARLKRQKGAGICLMGGGELAGALFNAGLVDEVGLNVHPVLLGSGIPMFPGLQQQANLKLVECRQLKGGCVYVLYRVKSESKSARRRGVAA